MLLCLLPLLRDFHYEFSFFINLVLAPLAPFVGAQMLEHWEQRPILAEPRRWASTVMVPATLPLTCALIPVMVLAWLQPLCNGREGFAFFILLPTASYIWGCMAGAVLRRWSQSLLRDRCGRAGLRLILGTFVAACLARAIYQLLCQPTIKVYSSLWGFFAGSLYDESVRIDPQLLAWRCHNALGIMALVLLLVLGRRPWQPRARLLVGWLGISVLVVVQQGIERRAALNCSHADLAGHLSQIRRRPGITLHLSPQLSGEQADRMADQHAFYRAELVRAMKLEAPPHFDSFVFADAEDKALWLGGRVTQFAKPWQRAMYISGIDSPHPVLAHEMVHVLATAWTKHPLGVPARFVVLPDMTLVEGLAVALAPDRGELGVMGEARALSALGLLGPVASNLSAGPATFWRQAPKVAYVQAGALLRYIASQHGITALRRLYAGVPVAEVCKQTPEALQIDFEASLKQTPLPPEALALVRGPLSRPSIFGRRCVHEVARLREAAWQSPPPMAVNLWHAANRASGGEVYDDLGLAQSLRAKGERRAANLIETRLLRNSRLTLPQKAYIERQWARDAIGAGDAKDALAACGEAVACPMPLAAVRSAWLMQQHLLAGDLVSAALLKEQETGTIGTERALRRWAENLNPLRPHDTNLGAKLFSLGMLLAESERDTAAWFTLTRAGRLPFLPLEVMRLETLAMVAGREKAPQHAQEMLAQIKALSPYPGQVNRVYDLLARQKLLSETALPFFKR